jgi:hypothetical protein
LLFIQDRDVVQTSTKRSARRNNILLNTNNSNNNTTTARIATVKSARRDNGVIPNVNISLPNDILIFYASNLEYP